MKAFVTGSTGFIGSHLVDRLSKEGWDVTKYKRGEKIPDLKGFDVTFHIAGVIEQKGIPYVAYQDAHVVLPLKLLLQHPKRLVYMSSACVKYPGQFYGYALTKLKGEEIVKESGVYYMIIRPGVVYGPGDLHLYPLFKWIHRLGRFFPIPGHNLLDPTYIRDVVDALMETGEGRTITVSGIPTTVDNFIFQIAAALHVSQPFIHIPPVVKRAFFARTRMFDPSTIAKTSLEVGLRETVQWYTERGML